MSKGLALVLIILTVSLVAAQDAPPRYESGVITAVSPHQQTPGQSDADVIRYDVSIKVGDTVYVVLYTPPNGSSTVKYSAGLGVLVLINGDTLTCNKFNRTENLPILRREMLSAQSGVDFSRMSSEYFSMKQQHLSETLGLTNDQQTKIQPILEQETGEVGYLVNNPTFSQKEKLNRWEKIVQASDKKIEPLLSQAQLEKLHAMRKEQKPKIEQIIKEQKAPANKN